jgi:glycosyltransferase involved in cell wall biosynthesis
VKVGLYLADQRWDRTLSKGIYGYSRLLAAALARGLSGHELVLILNRTNAPEMAPAGGGARAVILPAWCAGGAGRLLADHVLAPVTARRQGLRLLHFPKGFLPAGPWRLRATATVHDTIPLYYARHHPGFFPAAKLAYLRWLIAHTLRTAAGIVTDSGFSRTHLLRFAAEEGIAPPAIEVCPLATDLGTAAGPPVERREHRLLHLGSVLPHKRTRETIALFRRYNVGHGGRWRLRVAGLDAAPPEWQLPPGPDVEFIGVVDRAGLAREMAEARALLLLSSIEGFGLPAVEAWSLDTPVCYADAGALPEVMAGLPGRCALEDADRFDHALDEVLGLDDARRRALGAEVRRRYGLERFSADMVRIVNRWLDGAS